jgi:hypothetical protein
MEVEQLEEVGLASVAVVVLEHCIWFKRDISQHLYHLLMTY